MLKIEGNYTMSASDIQNVLQQACNPNYVPPKTWYMIGRIAYRAGLGYASCCCDDMRSGWNAAEGAAAWAYWTAMSREGLESKAAGV